MATATSAESLEVELVGRVRRCRTCAGFWGGPPYGPYPAYDWTADWLPPLSAGDLETAVSTVLRTARGARAERALPAGASNPAAKEKAL